MRRLVLSLVIVAGVLLAVAGSSFAQTKPEFRMGFKALADQIPDIAGQPVEDEHYGPNGDSLQQTTAGLMVWRKADNWTAFTNGFWTWINSPLGLQDRANDKRFDWEPPAQLPTPAPAATSVAGAAPTAVPTPVPTAAPVPPPAAVSPVNVLKVNVIEGAELNAGTVWVLGEIRNDGSAPAFNVQVSARLLSDSGALAGSGTTTFAYLGPGDTVGYRVDIKKLASYVRPDVSVTSVDRTFAGYGRLSVAANPLQKTSDNWAPRAGQSSEAPHYYAGDTFRYTGTATNPGPGSALMGTVYIWYLDDQDNVIWADVALAGAASLAPGDTFPFDVATPPANFNTKVLSITKVSNFAIGMKP